jgi:DNA phosphorothioation-dependent restriction protein DptG
MTEQLRKIYETIAQLPDEAQNQLAARIGAILEEFDEQAWDAIVSQPHVQQRLRELGQEALQEHQRGETIEGGFGLE